MIVSLKQEQTHKVHNFIHEVFIFNITETFPISEEK